jgi:protease-4
MADPVPAAGRYHVPPLGHEVTMKRIGSRLIPLLALPALASVALAQTGSRPSDPPGRVVHELRLAGSYQDLPSMSVDLTGLLGGEVGAPKDFYRLVADLKTVGKHSGGELLVDLTSQSLALNEAQVAELERAMDALRAAGIRTTAYLENATTTHYLAACLCDRVVAAEIGMIDLSAPALGTLYFKDALDLLGVQFQATRAGEFKGAVEPYVLSEMSSHLREHYRAMVQSMNARHVHLVSTRRRIPPDKVRELQGRRLLTARVAKESGLVDDLVPWQGARRAIGPVKAVTFESVGAKKKKQGFNFMSLLSGMGKSEVKKLDEDSIAVLHLSGVIVDGSKEVPGSIVAGPTVELIRRLATDDHVQAMVVRVNSPGGSGTASEAILLALRELAATKPVIVSMGWVAASGGYYVSMVGDEVLAEHNTITGSIGVFGMRPNVGTLARRVGVRQEVVALDDSAALSDVFRPLQDAQMAQIEGYVRDFYGHFRKRILEARRNLTDETLLAVAGGRVWTGQQALGLGLVDRLGGLDDAITTLKKKLGDDELPVVSYPEPDNNPFKMFESLLEGVSSGARSKLALLDAAGFRLEQSLAIALDALKHPGMPRVWMLLPCELAIR